MLIAGADCRSLSDRRLRGSFRNGQVMRPMIRPLLPSTPLRRAHRQRPAPMPAFISLCISRLIWATCSSASSEPLTGAVVGVAVMSSVGDQMLADLR
ncbi:hypothetical protein K456DRAFT_1649028 [Colletotrichum gloeosporioides 23]|nr:hypothetical protein K456DRAFT_1649028 [Colletotrichum gloeosporioides 23]